MTGVERAQKAIKTLENLMEDKTVTNYQADLALLTAVVWFDLIAEKIPSGSRVHALVRKHGLCREDPDFDRTRVADWLHKHFGYSVDRASRRLGGRITYIKHYDKGEPTT